MNYAIQSETCVFPFLQVTSRKRATKHSLIHVDQGLLLVKLGKQEYLIEPGQAVWIPLDCLCALTFFPNTQIYRVDFSVRLRDAFPHQAGLVRHTVLSLALIERLRLSERDDAVYPHLLQVLKTEVQNFEPALSVTPQTQALALWSATSHHGLTKEQHLVLLVREAMKRRLSGGKEETIVAELFSADHTQYQQMCQLVIGKTL